MDAPLLTTIQGTELVDVHAQLEPVTTEIAIRDPVDGTAMLVGVTLYAQLEAACVTVMVCPATVSVPVRELPVAFGATV